MVARPTLRFALGWGALLGMTSGCVTAARGAQLQAELRALQTRVEDQGKRHDEGVARLSEDLDGARRLAAALEKSVDELQRAQGQTVAGLDLKVEEVRNKVLELNGAIEVAQHRLGQLEEQVKQGQTTPPPVVAPSPAPSPASAPPAANAASEAPKKPKPEPRPKDVKELLVYGKRKLADDLDEARWTFQEIGRKAPREKGIADEAFFLLGDTYFKEKQWAPALQEYIKVVEKFAAGAFADDAYFRIGECSVELGNLNDAEIFFNEILKSYKTSPYAKDAKKKLDELAAKKKKSKK